MAKINIIYGEKGSGKTKKMVDSANRSVEEAKEIGRASCRERV